MIYRFFDSREISKELLSVDTYRTFWLLLVTHTWLLWWCAIQRSDSTLALPEMSRFSFLPAFEKIGPVQFIGSCARPKEMPFRELIKQF